MFRHLLFMSSLLLLGTVGASHINRDCGTRDDLGGEGDDYGEFTCDNSHFAPSICSFDCPGISYQRFEEDASLLQCHVKWDIYANKIIDAKWYGFRTYCYHFYCILPEKAGYGSNYECDKKVIKAMGTGENMGYKETVQCSLACLATGITNKIQCMPAGEYDEVAPTPGYGVWEVIDSSCGFSSCSSLATSPGVLSTCTAGANHLSECSFSCEQQDHYLSHYNTVRCISTDVGVSEWSQGPPTCIQSTDPYCTPLEVMENSGEKGIHCSQLHFIGSTCHVLCSPGYGKNGPYSLQCSWNAARTGAVWTAERFPDGMRTTCSKVSCRDPRLFPNGTFISCTDEDSLGAVDTSCFYSCPLGTKAEKEDDKIVMSCIRNPEYVQSAMGIFIAEVYPCEPIFCSEMSSVALSPETSFECTDNNAYLSKCTFTCSAGTTLGESSSWSVCEDRDSVAVWEPSPSSCKTITCEDLSADIPDDLTYSCTDLTNWNSKCTFVCSVTTWMTGTNELLCQDSNNDGKGEWSDARPTCEAITCTDLPDPSGDLEYSCTDSKMLNSKCSFSCPEGFEIQGTTELLCSDDNSDGEGEWSASFPTCLKLKCPDIRSYLISNAEYTCTKASYWGSTCSFVCNDGFWLSGGKDITCENARRGRGAEWNPQPPYCRAIKCPEITASALSDVIDFTCTSSNNWASKCSFTCSTGTWLEGESETSCMDSDNNGEGDWSSAFPTCSVIKCEAITASSLPATMEFQCTDSNIFASKCTFSCASGTWLEGEREISCMDKDTDGVGDWSSAFPTCGAIKCDDIPAFPLGEPTYSCTDSVMWGSKCSFGCSEGTLLKGDTQLMCLDSDNNGNGDWSSAFPSCSTISCEEIPAFSSGEPQYSCTDSTMWNSKCSFTCSEGLFMTGSKDVTCTDSNNDGVGEWSAAFPYCSKIMCKDIRSYLLLNMQFTCTQDSDWGSVCSFVCDEGFWLDGAEEITCQDDGRGNGKWSAEIPYCNGIKCTEITASMLPATMTFTCTKSNAWASKCSFACLPGTWLQGANEVTCVDTNTDGVGDWSSAYPTCGGITCGDLSVVDMHANVSFTCSNAHNWGSKCSFQCSPGNWLVGEHQLMCQDADSDGEGDWSSEVPTCKVILCEALEPDRFSKETVYSCSRSNYWSSECTFSCTDNMRLKDDMTEISCQDPDNDGAGTWEPGVPNCILLPDECDSPDGGHDVQCMISIWFWAKCTSDGTEFPEKISDARRQELSAISLREMLKQFGDIRESAESGNADAQKSCFGLEYPENCVSYEGPHSMECLKAAWLSVGCTEHGDEWPEKLLVSVQEDHKQKNLGQLLKMYTLVALSADEGEDSGQRKCYGLVYPETCEKYRGTHSLECLVTIWIETGCISEGEKYPVKLISSELDSLKTKDLRSIKTDFKAIKTNSDGGDVPSQLQCFGMEYPAGCTKYYGPYSVTCLSTIWDDAKCLHEGSKHPSKLDDSEIGSFNGKGIRLIRSEFQTIKSNADNGHKDKQMFCFGMEYPNGCTKYYGPHPTECLVTIWTAEHCMEPGEKYPEKLSDTERDRLDGTNIREISSEFAGIKSDADGGDTASQKFCFGMEYPSGCTKYFGPYSVPCLESIWEMAKCLPEGTKHPAKLDADQVDSFTDKGIWTILTEFETIKNKSDTGDEVSQMFCFGMVYPDSCVKYYGRPHPLECLIEIWYLATCVEEGLKFPSKLSETELGDLDTKNLREVITLFNATAESAESGNKDDQNHCFGMEYPDGCINYYGSHPVECLVTIWESAQCLQSGKKYPEKVSNEEIDRLNKKNIRQVINEYSSLKSSADNANYTAQMHCFGVVYPNGCTEYLGPYSVECLSTIWEMARCLPEGSKHPAKLSDDEIDSFNNKGITPILEEFVSIKNESDAGNVDSQMLCFGMVYPDHCTSYYGTHSDECLITIWISARCLPEGEKYPSKLSGDERNTLATSTLREVIAAFNTTAEKADDGHVQEQMHCFGLEYPEKCVKYYGSHPIACLVTIWKSALCLDEGEKFPEKLTSNEMDVMNKKNIRQIIEMYNGTKAAADAGNLTAQEFCFGLVYPYSCTKYYGPYDVECLTTIWEMAKCLEDGTKHPSKLEVVEVESFQGMGLTPIIDNFENIKSISDSNDVESQMSCFGMEYPDGCTHYYGPHPVECLKTIWKRATCLPEGYKFPDNLSDTELAVLNEKNIREVISLFNATAESADGGDVEEQKNCFGLEYPLNCQKYYGPHPVDCLVTMWKNALCLDEGQKHPEQLSDSEKQRLDEKNIREIVAEFTDLKSAADDANATAQLFCFGVVYPKGCREYYGPYTLECLESMWKLARCIPAGFKHPPKLSDVEFDSYDGKGITEITTIFEDLKAAADTGNLTAQNFCFGIEYPDDCTEYYGPYSVPCLETIWRMVRCLPEGSKHPPKLANAEVNALNGMGLTPVIDLFNSSALAADNGNVTHQQQCFGMEYPEDCGKYYGPHPVECLETIWGSARCIVEGDKHPSKLTEAQLNSLDSLNLRELSSLYNGTKSSADEGNTSAQESCFGITYPEHCDEYYGPYSVPCLETIWEMVKCLPEGTEYPPKLTSDDVDSFNGIGLRPLIELFNSTALQADSGSTAHQEKCFGMVYPENCVKYYGIHPVGCLVTIWKAARCLEEGTRYPEKYGTEEMHRIQNLDIRSVISEFNQTKELADSNDKDNQMFCFGMEYPTGCVKYYGPHPVECLVTMWEEALCLEKGEKHPEKLSSDEIDLFSKRNIRQIIAEFTSLKSAADVGNATAQQFCFGVVYPKGCSNYYGPYSVECLESMWEMARCLPEGTKFPPKLDAIEFNSYNGTGITEIITHFENIKASADEGNTTSQNFCFGLDYPDGCTKYYGSYAVDCLETIWQMVRCLHEGTKYPPKLTMSEVDSLNGMGLWPLINLFNSSALAADNGNVTHQLRCFGMEYPEHCVRYYGPNPLKCLETIWNSARCIPEGEKHPSKLSTSELDTLDKMNIRSVIDKFNNTQLSADSGNVTMQQSCFGIAYPEYCDKYYGQYSVPCLETIWEMVTCLPEGTEHPPKLPSENVDNFNGIGLRPLIELFNSSALAADAGDVSHQQKCFGMVYPEGCVKYYGLHPVECLITIWHSARCLEEGTKFPPKLDSDELDRVQNIDLRAVISEFNTTKDLADSHDQDNQLYCFGLVYPEFCTKYYGPHSVECLQTMWATARCLPEGDKFPPKLSEIEKEQLDAMNIRNITDFFNLTAANADSADLKSQRNCFGMEYPKHCERYYGPHPVPCLETMWNTSRCIPEGEKYPKKLSGDELTNLDNMNLREVIHKFNGTMSSADNSNETSQEFCFGIVYPDHCDKYYGPYSVPCLETIWDMVTCLEDGTEYPPKLPDSTVDSFTSMGLRPLIYLFNSSALAAQDGDVTHQKKCFGMVYPKHCKGYYGPHSLDCLLTIWEMVECLPEGTKYPPKLSPDEFNFMQELDLRTVIGDFNNTRHLADSDDVDNQMFCFGLVYPEFCTKYYGPHPTECLETMWETATCLPEGFHHPSKLNNTQHAELDLLNIRNITDIFNMTAMLADGGDVNSQNLCFGMEYPKHCQKYYGPHPIECLETIWQAATCIVKGDKHPSKLSESELTELDNMNLRKIISKFNLTKSQADSSNTTSQEFCFGLVYPDHCDKYYGPYSIPCLETMWELATCLPEGSEHPPKLPAETVDGFTGTGLWPMMDLFNSSASAADDGNAEHQEKCFGMEYPEGCVKYYGLHPINCLITIWKMVRCLEEGSRYPPKLADVEFERIQNINLRSVIIEFNTSRNLADNGDEDNQVFCFGLVYPEHCMQYYGPHPTECLITMWHTARCLEEGFQYPSKLSEEQHAELDSMTIRNVTDRFNTTAREADSAVVESQKNCYGMEYPAHCERYYGDHPTECLITIWLSARCIPEGDKYPSKLSSHEHGVLDTMNIRELINKFNGTMSSADNANVTMQWHCFGLAYPQFCDKYYGPYSVPCLETVWNMVTCLPEGSEHPPKLPSETVDSFNGMGLRPLIAHFNSTALDANDGEEGAQIKCFGMIYPENCDEYYGTHSMECLLTVWEIVKCLQEGTRYPTELPPDELDRVQNIDLRALIAEFNTTRIMADSNDEDNQLFCFGLVYPEFCTKYYGPHPLECLETMWETATCLPEGFHYPSKLSDTQHEELDAMNLRNVTALFNLTASKADDADVQSQKDCFGMAYPQHCERYYGPHPVECLETIWHSATCLDRGHKHPRNLSVEELAFLDDRNIRRIIDQFNSTKSAADDGNITMQQYCFGLVYPEFCDKYYGPYSVPCLSTIWDMVTCLPEGTEYPPKLASETVNSFTGMGIWPLIALFNSSATAADNADQDHQLKCFGMVYPEYCVKYYGFNPIECLVTIWHSVRCLIEGTRYPHKLPHDELNRIQNIDLRAVISEFNTSRNSADNNDTDHQLFCFGLVYPRFCTKYYGPHPLGCLETMWETARCLPEGFHYPNKLSDAEHDDLDVMDLRNVTALFNLTAAKADNADVQSQLDCFGMEYPEYCERYYGPHPVECLETIWYSATCIERGYKHPRNLTAEELTFLDNRNIRRIIDKFNHTKSEADNNNKTMQQYCFGLIYPEFCDKYYGPYSVPCLTTIWGMVTCLPEGTEYPPKLAMEAVDSFTGMGIWPVIALFNSSAVAADNGDEDHQMKCFGMVYPEHCVKYYGFHPIDCLVTIWHSVRCLVEGTRYPHKLLPEEVNRIQNINLREVISEFNTSRNLADSNSTDDQLFCFGLVYPRFCVKYYGPHPLECLETMWETARCLPEGFRYPNKLSDTEHEELDAMNLRNVTALFNLTAAKADDADVQSQKDCYGMEYPEYCERYYGPHPVECLETIWHSATCLKRGYKHPRNLTTDELTLLDNRNIRRIIDKFNGTKAAADNGNVTMQQYCFGLVYPESCDKYYGPYSVPCLSTIWDMVTCLPEGTEYPPKLASETVDSFTDMGIWPVIALFNSSAVAADSADKDHQLKCFGMIYPEHCVKYYGFHPIECLATIWHSVRCLVEGTRYPHKLPDIELNRIQNIDLRAVISEFNTSRYLADSNSTDDQLFCFGLVYPEFCVKYYGPHPVQCLETMWETARCLPEGYDYPVKLSDAQHIELDAMDIRNVTAFFNFTAADADNASVESQYSCYGMRYPKYCERYYGPHPVGCLETIWLAATCILEGDNYPTKLAENQLGNLDKLNLRKIIDAFNETKFLADDGSKLMQTLCFGLEYPEKCYKYYGPYPVPCLETIWDMATCLPEGTEYPPKLSNETVDSFTGLGLRPLIALFNLSALAADNGSVEHQLECFGMVYPEHCVKYYGFHPLDCLLTIWEMVRCLELGTRYPPELEQEERQRIQNIDLRAVIAEFNTSRNMADNGDKSNQMYCFGLVYPKHCTKYYGPHPDPCLETMWSDVRCVEQGYTHVKNLTSDDRDYMDTRNLRQIMWLYNYTAFSADDDNVTSQLACFGMAYPEFCVKYYGPHPWECLGTMWEGVRCLQLGTKYPNKLMELELTFLSMLNLRDVISNFNDTFNTAHEGNVAKQMHCFGMEFPDNCTRYYGPHSTDCLITIWIDVDCIEEGDKYPPKLSDEEHAVLDTMNFRELDSKFNASRWNANLPDEQEQLNCFGMVYYDNCTTYYGPLTLPCLSTIWTEARCIERGEMHPSKLEDWEIRALYKDLDQRKTYSLVNETFMTPANNGDKESQVDCYGDEFPDNCTKFFGPNSVDCLSTIFHEVGCVTLGYAEPHNLTSEEFDDMNSLNLWDIVGSMNETRYSADNASTEDQYSCFGMKYYSFCDTYYGPLNVTCLSFIWTEVVLCLDLGHAFPGNLSYFNKTSTYDHLDQRGILAYQSDIRSKADVDFDEGAQLMCYGLVLPDGCTYYPVLTDYCLDYLWINDTLCVDYGSAYPLSLNDSQKAHFYGDADLRDALAVMAENATDKMQCYGLVFPDTCSYFPPHNSTCLFDLYMDGGCDEDYGMVPTAKVDEYNQTNVRRVLNEFFTISDNAETDDTTGIDAEACHKPKFVRIADGLKVLFHIEMKTYAEAKEYCDSLNSLLYFSIDNKDIQNKLEKKLFNAYEYFETEKWWMGLDDLEREG